jgi:hypothetical protein
MYQLPHYSDALKQFPSAALTAYFASGAGGNPNNGNSIASTGGHHSLAAAAAAAAAVVSHNNSFSIDNILAPRPRLPVPLSPYYGSTSASTAQAAADFYCKYTNIHFSFFYLPSSLNTKGVRPKIYDKLFRFFFVYLLMLNVFNCWYGQ